MKVNKENEEVVSVEVHWYAIDTHPFDGVYKAEMVVEKKVCKKRNRKGQKINRRRIDILKLEEVDILVYDFKLTNKRHSSLQDYIGYQKIVGTINSCIMGVC